MSRASVYERQYIGVEANNAVGSRVRPTRELRSMSIEPMPDITVNAFRPRGRKYATTFAKGKDFTTGKLSGQPDYNEIIFPMASMCGDPVTTNPSGTAYQHIFTPQSAAANTFRPLTWHGGAENSRMAETKGLMVSEFGLSYNRDNLELSGSFFAQTYRDDTIRWLQLTGTPTGGTFTITVGANTTAGIAYNASTATVQTALEGLASVGSGNVQVFGYGGTIPTGIYVAVFGDNIDVTTYSASGASLTGGSSPAATFTRIVPGTTAATLVPILPESVGIYLDTTSGGLGTTQLSGVLEAGWNFSDIYNPVWTLDNRQASWALPIETPVTSSITLKVIANQEGMQLFRALRAGSQRFLRIEALGSTITGSYRYTYRFDASVQVVKPNALEDSDGVYACEFELQTQDDTSWGQPWRVTVINTLATLA